MFDLIIPTPAPDFSDSVSYAFVVCKNSVLCVLVPVQFAPPKTIFCVPCNASESQVNQVTQLERLFINFGDRNLMGCLFFNDKDGILASVELCEVIRNHRGLGKNCVSVSVKKGLNNRTRLRKPKMQSTQSLRLTKISHKGSTEAPRQPTERWRRNAKSLI